ncbi:MAG TPA: hypothetical protein VFB37_05245, partial [Steroidobacteraceae bacterium]|nr:hypothetical protein [Steroidobacteraceae bacterium]
MLDDEIDSTPSLRRRRQWVGVRLVLAVAAGVAVFGVFLLVAYEEAIARIPEHRAALERLVRAQTGLDVRFNELGVRWGWYGPEAVFRRVELDEPGTSRVLLRAPELVVGFDAWRTLRSGHPEAGRIELVAADIDFAGLEPGVTPHTAPKPSLHPGFGNAHPATDTRFDRMAILQRWRGVRIDLDGGTLRLPDPGGSATPFTLQIRRASLRRSDEEWSAYGLVFLPDRIGRMARVVMRVTGDLNQPGTLSGSVRLEAHRLLFSGCRDLLAPMTGLAAYLPRAGSGDLTTDVDFAGGSVIKATGNLRAAGLVFAGLQSKASRRQEAHEEASGDVDELTLERLRGDFRLARSASEWRLRVDSLEAGRSRRQASLRLDAARSGEWIRGTLEGAALKPIVAVARWMRLPMDLAGIRLNGLVREVGFDWSELRPEGDKLQLSARMQDITLMPRSGDFSLSGFDLQLQGSESLQTAELRSRSAHLELAQSRQYPLSDI